MEFLKTIVTSWPLAAVIIVFTIKGSLKKIIEDRLFKFKVGNVEIFVDRLLQEVDESLDEEDLSSEKNGESTTNNDSNEEKGPVTKTPQEKMAEHIKARKLEKEERERIYNLISEDPVRATRSSWSMVWRELKKLGEKNGLNNRYMRIDDVLYTLIRNDVLSNSSYSAIIRLHQVLVLMNTALKNGYKWTEDDASSFYSSCRSVLRKLRRINTDN